MPVCPLVFFFRPVFTFSIFTVLSIIKFVFQTEAWLRIFDRLTVMGETRANFVNSNTRVASPLSMEMANI